MMACHPEHSKMLDTLLPRYVTLLQTTEDRTRNIRKTERARLREETPWTANDGKKPRPGRIPQRKMSSYLYS